MPAVIAVPQKNFDIFPLSEKPEWSDTCAAWSHAEWICQLPEQKLEETMQRYRERAANTDRLPLGFVAVSALGKPMGMAGLKETEHPDRLDIGPWLASIFVHPLYRRQGVASRLIEFVTAFARDKLGAKNLYLSSANAHSDSLYETLGWRAIGTVRDLMGLRPEGELLMQRTLRDV